MPFITGRSGSRYKWYRVIRMTCSVSKRPGSFVLLRQPLFVFRIPSILCILRRNATPDGMHAENLYNFFGNLHRVLGDNAGKEMERAWKLHSRIQKKRIVF
ncbi:hypothetical protein CEXT_506721 [Caerostris extrusa]|uniref:Uncharacterized protein n=1 Tax=Caerostris extrusa TaxID=172846 RepID=A0AAV4W6A6_CAEEX|nr:hypothetical protein CEXT_506721 [Caerostris extrusa]